MQNNVKIGLIISNYNGGKWFEDCVSGILSQTRKPDDLVIVDDCSTDDSIAQIRFSLSKLSKNTGIETCIIDGIKVELLKTNINRGAAGARNVGIDRLLESTDVICFNDIDDKYYPDKIAKSIKVMQKFPEVGAVYTDYDTENLTNNTITREYKEPYNLDRLIDECIASTNPIISSKIFKIMGKYDERFRGTEDYQLMLRIANIASIYHIPESLFKYRLHGQNTTMTTPHVEFAKQINTFKSELFKNVQR